MHIRPPVRRLFFPPNRAVEDVPPLRNKGEHAVQVLTAGGQLELRRRYFWSKVSSGLYPVDGSVGIDSSAVSPGALEVCCTMGVIQDFAQGAKDLWRITGLRISKERLRQITEEEGGTVAQARRDGVLRPCWSADEARVDCQRRTRVYVGVDGVKVRTVTQEEKDKRRRQHAIRRQQRGRAGVGNHKPLPPAHPGSDDRFKEFKIGLFYDQSKSRVHSFATDGDHQALGRLLRQHADAIGLEQANEQISLTDGAPWIRKQILKHFKHLDATLLDYYHFSEHVWESARVCLGSGEEANKWAKERLDEIRKTGYRPVLAAIDVLKKKVRAESKRESLRRLRHYIVERWEMVEYPQAMARGWDIGSGPTEAACKNLTLRLKRTGMKWDAENASAIMNLVALRESGQWDDYWQMRRCA